MLVKLIEFGRLETAAIYIGYKFVFLLNFVLLPLHVFNQKILAMAYVINDDCIACGTCIDECPVDAISEGDIYVIDPELCTDCGSCAEVCPTEAIHPAE